MAKSETRVVHGGTVRHEHRHTHSHTHVVEGDGASSDAARGNRSPEGLREAAGAFHATERGGATPRE